MNYLKLALLVAMCMLTVACTAAKQSAATTTASTEWRIQNLEESFLNFREEQRLQADKNAEAAEAINKKLTVLEEQLALLKSGQVMMDAPDGMSQEPPADQGWVTDLKPEEDGWVDGQKVKPEEQTAQSAEEKPWDTVPGPPPVVPEPKVVERAKPEPAKKAAPKKMAAAPKKPMASGSQAMYDAALAKYWAGDFDGARTAFDQFVKKYPKSELVPNALYWVGETYYSQKAFAQSILAFKEVTGRFPKDSKAAAALLKIGMSYDKVGDPDNAIFYLRALVEDFPKSDPAKLARKELARLGG